MAQFDLIRTVAVLVRASERDRVNGMLIGEVAARINIMLTTARKIRRLTLDYEQTSDEALLPPLAKKIQRARELLDKHATALGLEWVDGKDTRGYPIIIRNVGEAVTNTIGDEGWGIG